ncbi:MAG: asparagine synthase (glutamine-hydrolyzing) [Gemmataceae bacterium]|nr:asparagine synthase (glutamine-hydrolyzing) [Gemmataceae bacterium]MCI0738371.1 asparagine synthase (glutamine-hydrolyzing) [Gemmataceae bacterium]
MCGIAGMVGVRPKPGQLKAMADALARRGPDDEGFFLGPDVGLAFRRLAIVDLAGGRQPMCNEDESVRLIFNGEIYDHDLLRRQLENKGHRFATDHSDTEVLVHGYEEWGQELFGKLNGMFGVAIWDERHKNLILARDRYGVKPLYYAPLTGGGLAFGSEIKSLFAGGLVSARPNAAGLLEYFSFQNLTQRQTMFAGVYQLEPGTLLVWRDGKFTLRRYWDVRFPRSRRGPLAELAEEHRAILTRALKRQIAADVPVKTYLSGGIDSTALTVVAHRLDPSVTAYSCIFDLDSVGADRNVDEREYSRLVAGSYGLERVEHLLPQDVLPSVLLDYALVMEDLRMGVGYPVYCIAQRVARDAKVVLSGTGGDEFHAGYVGRFQTVGVAAHGPPNGPEARSMQGLLSTWKQRLKRWLRGPKPPTTDQLYRSLLHFMIKPKDWAAAFTPQFLAEAHGFDPDSVMDEFFNQCPSTDWRDRVLYVDAKTYLAGLLAFEDKVSMAHSLETRVPLLDNELVDFVLDVPFDALWQGDTGKILFRESVRPWVPDKIYTKPKMGFGPPDSSWYRGKLRPWIESMLSPPLTQERGIFRPEYVETVLEQHFSGQKDNYYLIWSFLNLEAWCRAFGFYGAATLRASSWHVAA